MYCNRTGRLPYLCCWCWRQPQSVWWQHQCSHGSTLCADRYVQTEHTHTLRGESLKVIECETEQSIIRFSWWPPYARHHRRPHPRLWWGTYWSPAGRSGRTPSRSPPHLRSKAAKQSRHSSHDRWDAPQRGSVSCITAVWTTRGTTVLLTADFCSRLLCRRMRRFWRSEGVSRSTRPALSVWTRTRQTTSTQTMWLP